MQCCEAGRKRVIVGETLLKVRTIGWVRQHRSRIAPTVVNYTRSLDGGPTMPPKTRVLRCSIRQPGVERRGSVNTGKYSVLWCGHKGEASQTPRISFERVAIVPC